MGCAGCEYAAAADEGDQSTLVQAAGGELAGIEPGAPGDVLQRRGKPCREAPLVGARAFRAEACRPFRPPFLVAFRNRLDEQERRASANARDKLLEQRR